MDKRALKPIEARWIQIKVQHTKIKTELSLREQRFVWCLMQFSFTPRL